MTGRPKDAPSPWATDLTYTAPSTAWDAQPTKVQPSDAKKAAGFFPTERPPAEFLNWLWNNWGGHLQYLDGFQAKNWTPSKLVIDTEWDLTGEEKCICFDPVNQVYWMTGPKVGGAVGGKILFTWNTQVGWVESTFIPNNESSGIAASENGYVVNALVSGRLCLHAPTADADTWTDHDVATCTSFHGGEWDPSTGVWWHIGKGTDTHPGIWSSTEDLSATTKRTIGTPGSGAGDMKLLAVGRSGGVAGGDWDNGGGNIPQVWYRTGDETQTWTKLGSQNTIFGGGVMAFSYDWENELFLATISDGSFWISSDGGATWDLQKAADANWTPFPYHLATYGSLYMAMTLVPVLGGTGFALWSSTDLGVTWSQVAWPAVVPDDEPRSLVLGDGQFVLATQGQPADNRPAKVSVSLKL